MHVVSRVFAGTLSLAAVISLNNFVIDAESSVLTTFAIAGMYQAMVFFVGGLIGVTSLFRKTHEGGDRQAHPMDGAPESVNVTHVCNKKAKVIGSFEDEHIYDILDVTFSNGITLPYKFDTTISNFKNGAINHDDIKGGALVLTPGIVYVPA